MFETLLNPEMPLAARFFIGVLITIALIGLAVWLIRRIRTTRLATNVERDRQSRLGIIEANSLDKYRRLILIRRDNIEHLLLIGDPADQVIEPNIVRVPTTRRAPTENAAHPKSSTSDDKPQLPLELAEPPRAAAASFAVSGAEIYSPNVTPPQFDTSAEPTRPTASRPLQPSIETGSDPERATSNNEPWLPLEIAKRLGPAAN
jgi:flagellar biogenesis protein FliO